MKFMAQEAFEALQKNEYIRYEDLPLRAKSGRLVDVEFVSNVYLVGGDEFIVVLPDASQEVTRERAELICEYAKLFHLQFEGQSLAPVTLSLGVAGFPQHGTTSTTILRAVDAALNRAKHEGRSRVVVAG